MPEQCPNCRSENIRVKKDNPSGWIVGLLLFIVTGFIVLIDRICAWTNDDENGYFTMTVLGLSLFIWLWSVYIRFIKRRKRLALKCNDCQKVFSKDIVDGINSNKKTTGLKVYDAIYRNEEEYTNAIVKWMNDVPGGIVVAWFRNDLEKLLGGIITTENCRLSAEMSSSSVDSKPLLFAGHYPLKATEIAFCERIGISSVRVYSHLKMPLLKKIFSEKLEELIAGSGLQGNKDMYQVMVAHSISKSQECIANALDNEIPALSEKEWIRLNITCNIF